MSKYKRFFWDWNSQRKKVAFYFEKLQVSTTSYSVGILQVGGIWTAKIQDACSEKKNRKWLEKNISTIHKFNNWKNSLLAATESSRARETLKSTKKEKKTNIPKKFLHREFVKNANKQISSWVSSYVCMCLRLPHHTYSNRAWQTSH